MERKSIEIEKNNLLKIIYALVLLLVICIFFILALLPSDKKEIPNNKTLNWLNKIKPIYLNTAKSITFTTNQSMFTEDKHVIGINSDGQIFVYLTGNDEEDFNTLKHEIAHDYVNTGNRDLDEVIVRDIAKSNLEER